MSRLNGRRIVVVLIGVVLIGTGVAACGGTSESNHSDCDTVRAMLDYNTQYNASIQESAQAGDPDGSSLTRYQEWAERLHRYADEVQDQSLARQGDALAQLADETVDFVKTSRAGPARETAADESQDAQNYTRLAEQFREGVMALDQACPGGS